MTLNGKMVPAAGFQHQFTSKDMLYMLGESSNLSLATNKIATIQPHSVCELLQFYINLNQLGILSQVIKTLTEKS